MRKLIHKWVEVVGPASGHGNKRGGFTVGQYRERLEHSAGTTKTTEKEFMTKKEFRDHFVAKGMSPQWGDTEWDRRWADGVNFKRGVDADCKLPTVQGFRSFFHGLKFSGFQVSKLFQFTNSKCSKFPVDFV